MSFLKTLSSLTAVMALVATSAFADGQTLRAGKQIKVDTNGDGLVSLEELTAREGADATKIMARVDTNGDGFLDQDERDAAAAARGDKKVGERKVGTAAGMTKEDLSKKHGKMATWLIENADTNGDGFYSREEMKAAKSLFEKTHDKPTDRAAAIKSEGKNVRKDSEKRPEKRDGQKREPKN